MENAEEPQISPISPVHTSASRLSFTFTCDARRSAFFPDSF
jgi:hypothetical protein